MAETLRGAGINQILIADFLKSCWNELIVPRVKWRFPILVWNEPGQVRGHLLGELNSACLGGFQRL